MVNIAKNRRVAPDVTRDAARAPTEHRLSIDDHTYHGFGATLPRYVCRVCGYRFYTEDQAAEATHYGCPICDRVNIAAVGEEGEA